MQDGILQLFPNIGFVYTFVFFLAALAAKIPGYDFATVFTVFGHCFRGVYFS